MDKKLKFKTIIDQINDVVIITEIEPIEEPFGPKIVYVNESFVKLTGYTREEIIGKTPRILQGVKTDKNTLKRIREALEKKEPVYVELLNYAKDQTEYWLGFTIVPIKDSSGFYKYFAAIEHDLTERKKMEDAQAMLSALVEFSDEAIIGKTLEGTIFSWNKGAKNLYGYVEEESIGSNIKMLFPKDREDEFQQIIGKIINDEPIKGYETSRIHKDGHIIPVSVTISPIKDAEGNITGASTTARDITEQKRIQEQLKHLAEHDTLTGLINRTLFKDRLIQAIALAKREQFHIAVCFIDLDGFKIINDTYGHPTGDLLLCAAAKCMQDHLREMDTVARFGGDEFALILTHLNEKNDVINIMRKLIQQFSKGFLIENHTLKVSLSIGISLYPADGAHDLLKKADSAMYHAKKHGKNNFIFFHDIDTH